MRTSAVTPPRLTNLLVPPEAALRDVIASIDRNGNGIALVVDEHLRLIGTITDGDVRRAVLGGVDLDANLQVLLKQPGSGVPRMPTTAPAGTSEVELLKMMRESTLRHIPLVDEGGHVVDIALLSDLVLADEVPLRAVVMAGGFGTRLLPLTAEIPKPMLPVGGRPLLELIVNQLKSAGIRRIDVATHYMGEAIADHFGDGQAFGVDIQYVREDHPLGTAGALSLVQESDEPLLVINGDILTGLDFRTMLQFHREHDADMTVAVREYNFRVPYGVVELDGVFIRQLAEKPVIRHFINAGIYLLSPEVHRSLAPGKPCDMTDLIARLIGEGGRAVSFPLREYWLDIGAMEDYERALADMDVDARTDA